ncbi:MAG TPA: DUF3016 domain-containing protein [Burkholderiaceae bacterium]
MKAVLKPLAAFALIGLVGGASAGAVEVKFIEPAKFVDVRDSIRDRDDVLEQLAAHLKARAEKALPASQNLLIEIRDVDLAGDYRPWGRSVQWLRVMTVNSVPRLSLHYVLSEGDKVLRDEKVNLIDLGYFDRFNRYSDGDALRFDKPMIDDWVKSTFDPRP